MLERASLRFVVDSLTLDVVAISDDRKVTGAQAVTVMQRCIMEISMGQLATPFPISHAQCIELCSRKGQLPLPLDIKLSATRKTASVEGEYREFP
jgi:hypothetical protein